MKIKRTFQVTVYLKSGQSFVFDTTTLTTKRSPITNELISVEWKTPDDRWFRKYRRIGYVRLDEIAAIVSA